MTKQQVLDLYYLEARSRLLDVAAFLDRVDRAAGPAGFRLDAFRKALGCLNAAEPGRARSVLVSLSDPTPDPAPHAGPPACGAPPPAA